MNATWEIVPVIPAEHEVPGLRLAHSLRCRRVSTRYPRARRRGVRRRPGACDDPSDAQVAATVAAWEEGHGLEPRDWHAIGAEERDETPAA